MMSKINMRQNENSITNKTMCISTKLEKRNQVIIQKNYNDMRQNRPLTHISEIVGNLVEKETLISQR